MGTETVGYQNETKTITVAGINGSNSTSQTVTVTVATSTVESDASTSDNIITFKWLYSLQELAGNHSKLAFEMPIPQQLKLDFQPPESDKAFYQGAIPEQTTTSLVDKSGMNSTFHALSLGESPGMS